MDRSTDYLRWVHQVAEVTRLVNPPDVIEWGLDKVHQKELAVAGLPVIPTTWLSPGDKWPDPPAAPFVVKPSVSAGARSTALYRPGDHAATGHVWALQEAGQTVMVQEYIPAVDQDGETDLAYFKGHFSHAVRKKAMLRPGEGVLERPWERMEWTGLVTPNQAQVAVADSVVEFLVGRFGQAPTYCRVDLVRGPARARDPGNRGRRPFVVIRPGSVIGRPASKSSPLPIVEPPWPHGALISHLLMTTRRSAATCPVALGR